MLKISFVTLGAFVAACLCSNALAATISFDSDTSDTGLHTSWAESGFTISSQQAFIRTQGGDWCSPACPVNGTTFLQTQWEFGQGRLVLSAANGSLFHFDSFQYAEQYVGVPEPDSSFLHVLGRRADGTSVTMTFQLDGINDGPGPAVDFQTAELSSAFTNLRSVELFNSFGGRMSLDNLQVSPVPEPSTSLLLACGLVALSPLGLRRPLGDQTGR